MSGHEQRHRSVAPVRRHACTARDARQLELVAHAQAAVEDQHALAGREAAAVRETDPAAAGVGHARAVQRGEDRLAGGITERGHADRAVAARGTAQAAEEQDRPVLRARRGERRARVLRARGRRAGVFLAQPGGHGHGGGQRADEHEPDEPAASRGGRHAGSGARASAVAARAIATARPPQKQTIAVSRPASVHSAPNAIEATSREMLVDRAQQRKAASAHLRGDNRAPERHQHAVGRRVVGAEQPERRARSSAQPPIGASSTAYTPSSSA